MAKEITVRYDAQPTDHDGVPAIRTDKLEVKISPLVPVNADDGEPGRGVFARVPFTAGDIIEVCPAIVEWYIKDAKKMHAALYQYCFSWGSDDKANGLLLGFGSLYNHSVENANMANEMWNDEEVMVFYALRDIKVGEELLFDYSGGDEEIRNDLWFTDSIDTPVKKKGK